MNYLSSMSFLSVSLAKYTATLLNDSQYMLSEQKNEELRSDNYIINSTVREWLQELLQQVACCFTKADLMWNSGIFFFFFFLFGHPTAFGGPQARGQITAVVVT